MEGDRTPPRYVVLSVRAIVLWSILIVAVGVSAAVGLLLGLSGSDYQANRFRLDIIQAAGTTMVGTGGAAALLLAARRQRTAEIDLRLKDNANRSVEYDAVERRVTEMYAKAAEQLGSDKAPVRSAGLYALERLAQGNQTQRQTVVNVICSYLRMPYTAPDSTPEDDKKQDRFQEKQVRLAAQRILRDHARRKDESFWADIDIDLTGATLVDWDWDHCTVRDAGFSRARFTGSAWFRGANFAGEVDFGGARFTEVAVFDGVVFRRWPFLKSASFDKGLPPELDETSIDPRPQVPATARPQPYSISSADDLRTKLDQLRRHAELTVGDVASRSEHLPSLYSAPGLVLDRDVVAAIVAGDLLTATPEQLLRFTEVCGCAPEEQPLWLVAWGRLVFADENEEEFAGDDQLVPASRRYEIEFEAARQQFYRRFQSGSGKQ